MDTVTKTVEASKTAAILTSAFDDSGIKRVVLLGVAFILLMAVFG
jgi:hypothetical protein